VESLYHWNLTEEFSASQAASLMVGIDPSRPYSDWWLSKPVSERIKNSYEDTLKKCLDNLDEFNPEGIKPFKQVGKEIYSIKLIEILNSACAAKDESIFSEWHFSGSSNLVKQKFSRLELSRWLTENNIPAAYSFHISDRPPPTSERSFLLTAVEPDIDPTDLPEELDAANMAFRAVLQGYGNQKTTFKNRLIDYLKKNYQHLKQEAIDRISIVANPDKAPGRRKNGTE
jgi:hypothetical protein